MRDLKKSDRNRVVFNDTVSGTKIGVYYETPTVAQVKGYRQASIRRQGNKVVMNTFDPALKYGLEIITGIDEGAFGYDGQPISADPVSPHFRQDWKMLLAETASDIVTLVAQVAFDGVRMDNGDGALSFEGEKDGEVIEEALPLAKS